MGSHTNAADKTSARGDAIVAPGARTNAYSASKRLFATNLGRSLEHVEVETTTRRVYDRPPGTDDRALTLTFTRVMEVQKKI